MKLINKLKLKQKLLLLGILPAATLSIIVAIYLTSARLNEMYELLHKKNQSLALSIAESSINDVFSGNYFALQIRLNAAINEPDIVSIIITDANNKALANASNNQPSKGHVAKNIIQAIKIKRILQQDDVDGIFIGENVDKSDSVIGYVVLSISYHAIKVRQQRVLLNSFYITLLLLVLIALIAHYISQVIGKPILDLAKSIEKIKQGDFNVPASYKGERDEISILASGIHDMAAELQDSRETLEKKVSDATLALRQQNDKLYEAQQEISESADIKSRLVSHISHEIRTPLNGIIGFLNILQSTHLDKKQQHLVDASRVSSTNLQQIINEVLDFSQLDAGKIKIKPISFNLQESIEKVLHLLSAQAKENGVSLKYQHDVNAPRFIRQDPVKFGQILINLINNAIKFSPNSVVTVSLKINQPKDKYLEVCVADQGIGISKENIKLLFNEFIQLDSNTTEPGTGLGLAITKNILDALHGDINVSSILNEGSVFCFSIPFTPVDDKDILPTPTPNPEDDFPDLSTVNILVADDNEINRLLLSTLLENQNAHVTLVNDGQQALDKSSSKPFDLMLFDLRMPFLKGDQVLNKIRQQPQNPNYKTPAIAITAHVSSGVERAAHINAFDGYLIKPIEQTVFFKLVAQLLSEHNTVDKPFYVLNSEEDTSTPNHDVFVLELAKRSMNNDLELIALLLNKFFKALPEQISSTIAYINEGNYEAAREVAHKIHGSAAYCGTPRIKQAAKQLEVDLQEQEPTRISQAIQTLDDETKAFLGSKEAILKSIS
ncbi:MAG: response regulator [Cycloclasticus sp.]|nr:response regulator [Cycloclasticus sp.]